MSTVRSTFGLLILCALALGTEPAEAASPAERALELSAPAEPPAMPRLSVIAPALASVDPHVSAVPGLFALPAVAAAPVSRSVVARSREGLNPRYRDWTVAELRDERNAITLGGPVSLILVGATLSVVGGVSTLVTIGLTAYMFGQEDAFPILLVASATGAGMSMALLGGFALGQRIRERDELTREIQLRQGDRPRRRNHAALSLSHGPLVMPVGLGWGFQGAF